MARVAVTHVHEWHPVEDAVSRYRCTCGDVGRRGLDGRIREDRSAANVDPDDLVTARPAAPDEIEDCTGWRRRLNPDNWRAHDQDDGFDWGSSL
jgi:hypothetical protein